MFWSCFLFGGDDVSQVVYQCLSFRVFPSLLFPYRLFSVFPRILLSRICLVVGCLRLPEEPFDDSWVFAFVPSSVQSPDPFVRVPFRGQCVRASVWTIYHFLRLRLLVNCSFSLFVKCNFPLLHLPLLFLQFPRLVPFRCGSPTCAVGYVCCLPASASSLHLPFQHLF